jgi:hypothetical protein
MNKSEKKIYILFSLFSFIFIVFTTNYLNLFDIIYVVNQTDAISYSEIAKNAPYINLQSDIIIQHVAQRFFIPYLVGNLANLLNIDFFTIFKIFTYIFILLYLFLIYKFVVNFNFSLRVSILFFSLLSLTPYTIRHHLFNPVQAHDMLFFCIGLIFSYTIIKKKFLTNFFITIFSIYLRQTSIALLIGSSILLILNRNIKKLLLLLILYFLSLFVVIKIGQSISNDNFPINLAYGIINYDFTQIEKLIKFILLAFFPFLPLTVILFGKINKNIEISTSLILLFVCAMMIGQPILGGPDGSVNNVGRIANLCYPIITMFCFYNFNFNKFVSNNYLFYPFIIGLYFWSLHPTYSLFKFFGILRFYNY